MENGRSRSRSKPGRWFDVNLSAGQSRRRQHACRVGTRGSRGCEALSLTRDAIRDRLTSNPEVDSAGNAAIWYFVDVRGGMGLLEESIRDHAGNAGLHVRRKGETPSVFVNATDRPLRVWTDLAPRRSSCIPRRTVR